ncbi:MAG: alpha-E domain-containing protein [Pirellulaceae bacterium]
MVALITSRAADNLFWLGRNVERAEQLTRLVRITLQQLTSGEAVESAASGLAYACQQAKQLSSEKKIPSSRAALARQLVVNVLNPDDIYSLRNVVRACPRLGYESSRSYRTGHTARSMTCVSFSKPTCRAKKWPLRKWLAHSIWL